MYGHPVGGSIHEYHPLHEAGTIRPCYIVSSSWPKIKLDLTVKTQLVAEMRLTQFFLIDISRLPQETYGAWCHEIGVTPCWAMACVDPGSNS